MRIVVVTWRDLANPLAGGSEVVIDRLVRELKMRDHQVVLVCGGPVGPREYPVIEAGGTFSQYAIAPFVCRKRFRDWDLLVDVENGIPYFSPLWWKGPRLCLVHHVHTEQWRTRFGRVISAFGRWAEKTAMPFVYRNETFIAISESTETSLQKIGVEPDRIRVIHSGIDLPEPVVDWVASKSNEPLFIAVGRMVPHKRIDLILNAWERVRNEIGGRFVIAGDGPERAYLESIAPDGVQFVGRVDASVRDELFKRAWLLLHAAHHEGWGLVIIEAASFSTPTLALDADGVHDAVVNGETGILVDDSNELAEAWVRLAKDPLSLEKMGLAARRRSEQFSWSSAIDSFIEVADEVTAESGSR